MRTSQYGKPKEVAKTIASNPESIVVTDCLRIDYSSISLMYRSYPAVSEIDKTVIVIKTPTNMITP